MFFYVSVRSGNSTCKRASLYRIVGAILNAGTHVNVQLLVISSTCALTNACLYAYVHISVCLGVCECWRT
jgi:hypothetical protein